MPMRKNNKQSEIEKLKAEIERLKKELKKRKKYGLVWEDKPEDVAVMCKEKLPVLKEVKSKEIITDKEKPVNLLIEGDNYHALSVLNYTHAKKVDVIYIDPPYNTGNKDFIFNDHYVDKEDAYRHSKWLSFMEKRLKLARNLLKETGVIFISIDDNEASQLKLLCDEIFGEMNLLEIFYLQVRYASKSLNEKDPFQKLIEQVLIYARNKNKFTPNRPKIKYSLD
ncbi:MAG: site-specific DNA-methyltransferase, partial [Candidatus Aenigmarchaeota archaeon]|nr:site-specific DNA-methyltransferase [Candidatus Aenigmarchaeota archaeon]